MKYMVSQLTKLHEGWNIREQNPGMAGRGGIAVQSILGGAPWGVQKCLSATCEHLKNMENYIQCKVESFSLRLLTQDFRLKLENVTFCPRCPVDPASPTPPTSPFRQTRRQPCQLQYIM